MSSILSNWVKGQLQPEEHAILSLVVDTIFRGHQVLLYDPLQIDHFIKSILGDGVLSNKKLVRKINFKFCKIFRAT